MRRERRVEKESRVLTMLAWRLTVALWGQMKKQTRLAMAEPVKTIANDRDDLQEGV